MLLFRFRSNKDKILVIVTLIPKLATPCGLVLDCWLHENICLFSQTFTETMALLCWKRDRMLVTVAV